MADDEAGDLPLEAQTSEPVVMNLVSNDCSSVIFVSWVVGGGDAFWR